METLAMPFVVLARGVCSAAPSYQAANDHHKGARAMRTIGRTCLAIAAVGVMATVAVPATAADILSSRTYGAVVPAPVIVGSDYDMAYDAVAPGPVYGYGYVGPAWRRGSYYSYGAGRANPSLSPNGWDQDNPRDQQLQGHN